MKTPESNFLSESKETKVAIKETQRINGKVSESFEVDENGGYVKTLDLVFHCSNGKDVSFSSLLPEGWAFVRFDPKKHNGSKFSASHIHKEIVYPELDKEGYLLSILHEIGHSWQDDDMLANSEKDLKNYTDNFDNRDLTQEQIVARGEDIHDYEDYLVYDGYGKGTGGYDNDEPWFNMYVPKKIIADSNKKWAEVERGANVYALKKLKELRSKGVDLEPTLDSADKIKSITYSTLATYDKRSKSNTFTKGKKYEQKDVSDLMK
ncbi:MAG: hypothetical protein WCK48_03485 [bacterium]